MAWLYVKENIRPRLEQKIRSIKQLIAQHEAKQYTYTDEEREQFEYERFMQQADNHNTYNYV